MSTARRASAVERWSGWIIGLLLVLAAAIYLALVHNDLGDVTTDSPLYLLLAKSLATGRGFRDIHLPGHPPEVTVPFAFPLLLSGIMRVAGERLWPLHLAVAASLWAGLWGLARWLRAACASAGGAAAAAVVLGLIVLNPRIADWSLVLLPVFPYFCLSLAALLCVERYADASRPLTRWSWISAAALCIATFFWLPGIALCIAALLCLLTTGPRAHRRAKAWWLGLAVAVPVGAWLLRCAVIAHAQAASPLAPFYAISGYGTYWRSFAADAAGADVVGRCASAARFYGSTLAAWLAPGPWRWMGWCAMAFAAVGGAWRWRRGPQMLEWYLPAYGLLLAVNPYLRERYLLPVLPFLYAYAVWGVIAAWRALCPWIGRAHRAWTLPRLQRLGWLAGALLVVPIAAPAAQQLVWRLCVHQTTLRLPGQTTAINWAHFLERRTWMAHPDELLAVNDFCELHAQLRDAKPGVVLMSFHPRLSAWLSGHEALMFPLARRMHALLPRTDATAAQYYITLESGSFLPLYRYPSVVRYLARCRLVTRRPFAALYQLPSTTDAGG